MAYRIVYGEEPATPKLERRGSMRLRMMTAVCFLTFALVVKLSWAEGTQKLREYLIPGEMTVTQEAFQAFAEDIREGEQVKDALTAFCRDIIRNG